MYVSGASITQLALAYLKGADGFDKDLDEWSVLPCLSGSCSKWERHHSCDGLGDIVPFTRARVTLLPCMLLPQYCNKRGWKFSKLLLLQQWTLKVVRSYIHRPRNSLFQHEANGASLVEKSRDQWYSDARKMLKRFESSEQSFCAKCGKDVQPGEKFKQCSKCKAQWYCSRNAMLRRGRLDTRKTANVRRSWNSRIVAI